MKKKTLSLLATAGLFVGVAGTMNAQLSSQLGILDLTANGGINPATNAAWQDGDTYRLAFITIGTSLATSDDITTYNAFVQNAAANSATFANLGSVDWNVIGSTDSMNARENTSTDPATDGAGEGVFLLDGTSVFAADYADLWDGANNNPNRRINRTENGDLRAGNYPQTAIWEQWSAVWTGTNNDGSANSLPLGNDGNVRFGLMQAEFNFWLSRNSSDPAAHALPLYGLSEVLTVSLPGGIPGDFDGDGDVDGVDIAEMFSNFNGPGGGVPANPDTDLDSDGDVDGVDIAAVFGAFTGPLAPAIVPEPNSLVLSGLVGMIVARRRRNTTL